MPASPEAAWRWLATAAILLLAGCATLAPPAPPLPAAQQEQQLRALDGFSLSGRTGVVADGEGFNASLTWQQTGAEARLKLSGLVGAGGLTLVWQPGHIEVVSSRGEVLRDAEAEQAILRQLGFLPPFEALRYWMLGLAAPGETPATQEQGDNGRLAALTQQQWRISFDRWTSHAAKGGAVLLPQRLTATRDGVRLRVMVDRWKLEPR